MFVVSPTYYGLCSDLRAIGEICHRKGVMPLVDDRQRPPVFFPRLPEGALAQGADLCSQSHKVTGSLTQSSLLHLQGQLAEGPGIGWEESLRMVQSTSPSYLLMASLDAARYELAVLWGIDDGAGSMSGRSGKSGDQEDTGDFLPGQRAGRKRRDSGSGSHPAYSFGRRAGESADFVFRNFCMRRAK